MSSVECEEGARLYVGNLPYSVTTETLVENFGSTPGFISGEVVTVPKTGRSRGYGLVTCASQEAADNLISQFNETELEGRKIFLREDNPDRVRKSKPRRNNAPVRNREPVSQGEYATGDGLQVYVGNLAFSCDVDRLTEMFEPYGNITNADVPTGFDGRSRGYGIVRFDSKDAVDAAIQALDGTEQDERTIRVNLDKYAGNKTPGGAGNGLQIYVGSLPFSFDGERLAEIFQEFGTITHAEVPLGRDGRSRGFGIVRFEEKDAADKAIDAMDGSTQDGREIRVNVDKFASN